MKIASVVSLLRGGLLPALVALGPMRQAQRIAFLAGAGRAGVLARLHEGPATRAELAALLGAGNDPDDALGAWLSIGVQLGDLSLRSGRYGLRSRLARRLGDPRHDAVLGMVEQTAGLYHRVIREAP